MITTRKKPEKPQFPFYPHYYKTGDRLKFFLNHPDLWEDGQESLDRNFAYLLFDLDGERAQDALDGIMFERPYWLDLDAIVNQLGLSLDWLRDLINDENIYCQYEKGYNEHCRKGDFYTDEDMDYIYIGSQNLDEEIDHQAEDGTYHFEYRGPSFLRIWLKLSDETSTCLKHYAKYWREEKER